MNGHDISWFSLATGSLLLLIPLFVFYYFRTKLIKPFLIAFARMFIQLLLVGFYLKIIFDMNSVWINISWVLLMMFAASATILKRIDLNYKKLILPVVAGVGSGILVNTLLFATVIIDYEIFISARYIIPITGMILGNCLSNSIISIRSYYQSLIRDEEAYKYSLILSGNRKESLSSYISSSLKDAFSPSIASTATMGLIWLPGMMTGQILGGSNPLVAIKYQIIVMVAIFTSGVITSVVSILSSSKTAFNSFDVLLEEIKPKTKS